MAVNWVPLATAGLSFLGGLFGNRSRAREARRDRQFQAHMYRHRHQYEVEDLRAAGLNPILSAGGSPATPGGAMAQQQDIVTPAVNSAMAARRLQADVDHIEQSASNIAAQEQTERKRKMTEVVKQDLMRMDQLQRRADIELKKSQIDVNSSTAAQIRRQSMALDEELKKLRHFGKTRETGYGQFLMDLENFMRSTGFKGGSIPLKR